jgi:hypothetical protein
LNLLHRAQQENARSQRVREEFSQYNDFEWGAEPGHTVDRLMQVNAPMPKRRSRPVVLCCLKATEIA